MDLPPKGKREWEHWLKLKDTYGSYSLINITKSMLIIATYYTLTVILDFRAYKLSNGTR